MVHFLPCNQRGPSGAAFGNVASLTPLPRGEEKSDRAWGQVGGQISRLPLEELFCSGAVLYCTQLPCSVCWESVNGIHFLFSLLSFINQVSLRKLQSIFFLYPSQPPPPLSKQKVYNNPESFADVFPI